MFAALDVFEKKFESLSEKMGDPEVASNPSAYEKLARELADIRSVVTTYREYKKLAKSLNEAKGILSGEADEELASLAKEEVEELSPKIEKLKKDLRLMLLPKDPHDDKNIILEIRAGTGGEEAALFAASLYRMYTRYAERHNFRLDVLSLSETGIGGFKEIIATVIGNGAYSRLKFESGTHRVQRVPETEASGRIHTSACTVAIMPEANDVEVEVDENDLRIDVFRAGGHGGQSVNTTDSAVRITHIPTGVSVSMQDEKSQHKNRAKAMKVLMARLQDLKEREERDKRSETRKSQVGTGDRSERIRTYNFPQKRITDHRINMTIYKLDYFLDGDMDEMIEALAFAGQEEALKQSGLEKAGLEA